ncbi:thioredoxin Trx2 [Schizosaccharomyces japonicus yFS275]|uniref:Thioredoxin Trx2 n=1 Tax=Schizosaccharomyces japonicus (strain yFS275 / FY16936) TaxID=402676 RepID=B6JW45_SCHJY|nr:thioredoxin Trx2 [Schizosaccharomyces japonicus yFS275]EEB05596.2 thioredoxin Trx2 [Schizosaccharomyces japonicus yFS275]
MSMKSLAKTLFGVSKRTFSYSSALRAVHPVVSSAVFNEKISSPKLTVADFYATWCGPCKTIHPLLVTLSEKYDDVSFIKVDVDQMQDLAQQYGVYAMPTLMVFKNGKLLDQIVGADLKLLRMSIAKNRLK